MISLYPENAKYNTKCRRSIRRTAAQPMANAERKFLLTYPDRTEMIKHIIVRDMAKYPTFPLKAKSAAIPQNAPKITAVLSSSRKATDKARGNNTTAFSPKISGKRYGVACKANANTACIKYSIYFKKCLFIENHSQCAACLRITTEDTFLISSKGSTTATGIPVNSSSRVYLILPILIFEG